MDEGLNHLHKQLRMRSRVKLLHVESYEEAILTYEKYRRYLLGVITDVRFWKMGRLDGEAGVKLVHELRRNLPELPICVQSAEPTKNSKHAAMLNAHFLDKNSDSLLQDMERWLMDYMGFGDFIFRDENQNEICRAKTPRELVNCIERIELDTVIRHAKHHDFSHWMMARTEIKIAERLYPLKVENFPDKSEIRTFLIHIIETELDEKQSDVITHYSREKNPFQMQFMRLGEGSLGGKARGIGFLRYLLARQNIRREFPNVQIRIPATLVICSDIFRQFMQANQLWEFALNDKTKEQDIRNHFLHCPIDSDIEAELRTYLEKVRTPLAVRSSSLMEDSRHLPLAGMYATYMLKNSEERLDERLQSLLRAIKLVWASTFADDPKAYFRQTSYRLKDERMSVIIQNLGGERHGDWFYPTFSGVAQSYNFYPISYMKPEDGVAQIALGLGKMVVEGGAIVRFCPQHPLILPQFANVKDWLYHTQKHFYALQINGDEAMAVTEDGLKQLPIDTAEEHGVLQHVASVYQSDSDLLADSFFYDGPRVVTFMKVLKDTNLQLGKLLNRILKSSQSAMRTPVEIEFAVEIKPGKTPVFYPLQLRPMTSKAHWEAVDIAPEEIERALCYSNQAHGNGRIEGIRDIVFVKPEQFRKSETREIAAEIGIFNKRLVQENRPYLLIGFGRWGSVDPSMGIGVKWAQISGVKVLIEVGLPDFNVDPAQGTHFFQNVTSLNVGCLSVPHGSSPGIDWRLIKALPIEESTEHLCHLRLERALEIKIDGAKGEGVVLRREGK